MKKLTLVLVALAVLLLPCQRAGAADKLTVILDWFVNPDHAPLYVALEKGFFKDRGLEVELIAPSNPSDPAQLVAAGKAEQANEDEIGVNEDYNRISILASSLTRDELLTLDVETILRRLFWQEPLLRFEPQQGEQGPRFACTCSRERVGRMLHSLGREEAESLLAEQGQIDVACEYCGQQYRFDPVDAAQIFAAPAVAQTPAPKAVQ